MDLFQQIKQLYVVPMDTGHDNQCTTLDCRVQARYWLAIGIMLACNWHLMVKCARLLVESCSLASWPRVHQHLKGLCYFLHYSVFLALADLASVILGKLVWVPFE